MRIFLVLLSGFFLHLTVQAQSVNFDAEVQKAFDAFDPIGLAVAVVNSDGIVYKKAMGYKNAEKKTSLDTRSLFSIASVSKAFTAAAVGMLVEDEKLKWTDKAIQYIPELRLKDAYITRELDLTDLLSHRSGFATFDGDLLWYGTDYTDAEIISHMEFLEIPQGFRRDFGYQNLMFMLAGEVVSRVDGRSWSDFIQQELFNPLGMKDSRPSNDELQPGDNLTDGHIHGTPIGRYDFNGVKPAASIYSNVEDLAKWAQMYLNEGKVGDEALLAPSTINEVFSAKTLLGVSRSKQAMGTHFYAYGMGWFLSDYKGVKVIEHSGGMPGYISKMCIVPELDLAFVSLNNGEEPFVNDALKWTVIDHYLRESGRDVPPSTWIEDSAENKKRYEAFKEKQHQARVDARIEGTQPTKAAEELAGVYSDPSYGDATVSLEDGALQLVLEPARKTLFGTMSHWHHDTYRLDFPDTFLPFALVTFYFDEKHAVSGFKIDCPSPDFHFYKLDFVKK
ncbi:MAG: serine hydrolase [Saprospiraceae bacterium]